MVRRVQDGMTRVEPVFEFDEIDVTTNPASGDIVSQGFCPIAGTAATGSDTRFEGFHGNFPAADAQSVHIGFFDAMPQAGADPTFGGLSGKGFTTRIKGRVFATSGVRNSAGFAKFAIGIAFGDDVSTTNIASRFGNDTDATRNLNGTVAVIVDNSNNIQSYNNIGGGGGGAPLTDSGFDADLTLGASFLLEVEVPTASGSCADLLVTIQFQDNGGAVRTILNAVSPAQTGGTRRVMPVGLINVPGVIINSFYEVAAN